MKKGNSWGIYLGVIAILIAAYPLVQNQATAQNTTPSSKVTAKLSRLNLVEETTTPTGWVPILSNSLRVPNQKDVFIGVSLECGLFTETVARSKGGRKDTSTAEASIQVRVVIDGQEVEPGPVTFARRSQKLSATLQGIINDIIIDPDTGLPIIDESTLTEEEIELVIETLDANAFNFVSVDLNSGIHTVEVQARIATETSSQSGSANAKALIGKGSMIVREVRLIRNEDILLD